MTTSVAASATRPRPTPKSDRTTALLYAAYWGLLCLFVLAFVLKTGLATRWLVGALMIGVTLLLYTRRPLYALCTLPGSLMLGVIARLPLGGAGVHFGDLHLLAVTLMFLIGKQFHGRIFVGKAGLAPLVVVVIMLSWLFSIDMVASTITMLGLLELFLVYLLTLNLVKGEEDVATVLRAWCGTITLCSALVILSYMRSEPLILNADEAFAGRFGNLKLSETAFLRASFFVTSFNFPLACTLVMLMTSLLLGRGSIPGRVVVFGALLVNVVAAVLLANKSVMGAAAITSVAAAAFLVRYKRFWLALSGVAIASIIVVSVVGQFSDRIISPRQALLFIERLSSNESFTMRFNAWRNVATTVFTSPHVVLIGLGPDVSTRTDDPYVTRIFGEERAADSDYFFILLNYGLIVLVIYLRYFVRAFRLLLSRIRGRHQITAVLLLGCMVTWLLVGIAQQGGAAKTMSLLVQIAAILELIRTNRYDAVPANSKH